MDHYVEEIISSLSYEQINSLREQYKEEKRKSSRSHPEIPPEGFYTFIVYWQMEQILLASKKQQEKEERELQETQESLELDDISSSHDTLIKGRGRHHRQLQERFDKHK